MVIPIGCPPLSPFWFGFYHFLPSFTSYFKLLIILLTYFRFFTLYLLYLLLYMDWPPMQNSFFFCLSIFPHVTQSRLYQMTPSCRWSRHDRCFCLCKHPYQAIFASKHRSIHFNQHIWVYHKLIVSCIHTLQLALIFISIFQCSWEGVWGSS